MMPMAMSTLLLCLSLAAGNMTHGRVKRSDDINSLTTLNTVVNQLSAQLNSVLAAQNAQQTRLNNLETELGPLQRHVAFRAHFESPDLAPLHAPLKFNYISFNDGNAYDPSLGVFLVPVNGVYIFSVHVSTQGHEKSILRIRVNGKSVSTLLTDDSAELSGVSTVVQKLSHEDKVWVQMESGPNLHHGSFTFFTGALLYAA